MRTGEVFALTWDDIDLDNRIIKISKQYMQKTKKKKKDGIYVLLKLYEVKEMFIYVILYIIYY